MRLFAAAIAISVAMTPVSGFAAPGDPAPMAMAWLTLIDQGQYARSWAAAGALFKAHIDPARWGRLATAARGPLGKVVSRTFVGDEPSNSLPGAPDGFYDQVRFSTVFAHKAQAVETVVMARQKNGWRVDGYFVR